MVSPKDVNMNEGGRTQAELREKKEKDKKKLERAKNGVRNPLKRMWLNFKHAPTGSPSSDRSNEPSGMD